eukprot:1326185-Amorphochlora_amoeboformis.AAC.1
MEILGIVRRSYHPVVPGSTRWYPSVPGSNGRSCQQQVPMQHGKFKSEFGKTSIGPLSTLPLR